MASLALHGLMQGSQRIPDKAFEKIPFAGPRYFKEKEERKEAERRKSRRDRRNRRRQQRDDPQSDTDPYDSEQGSEYEGDQIARRSHRRSEREGRRSHRRGYDSDPESPVVSRDSDDRSRGHDVRSGGYNEVPRDYDNSPYFPPPPRIAVDEPEQHNKGIEDEEYIPRPYNPAEYNQDTGTRDTYYSGHPQERAPFTPPPGPPASQIGAYQPSNAPTDSSVADRYRPSNADQYDRAVSSTTRDDHGSPTPNYPSAVAIRPPSPYGASQASLSPRYDGRYDDEDDRPHRRHSSKDSRKRSKSRKSSRSRSRVKEARNKVKDGFETHKGEIGAGALGALAGGLLGRELAGKKGNLGMVIGAALGGVGAGLYGKHQEKQKELARSRSRSLPRREYAGYESY